MVYLTVFRLHGLLPTKGGSLRFHYLKFWELEKQDRKHRKGMHRAALWVMHLSTTGARFWVHSKWTQDNKS